MLPLLFDLFPHLLESAFSLGKGKKTCRQLVQSSQKRSQLKKVGNVKFLKMASQQEGQHLKKLSLEDKARIVSWREATALILHPRHETGPRASCCHL
jgi:hypothetical protein